MRKSRHGHAYVVRLTSLVASKDFVLKRICEICEICVSLRTLATTCHMSATCHRYLKISLRPAALLATKKPPRLSGQSTTLNPRRTLHTHYLGP